MYQKVLFHYNGYWIGEILLNNKVVWRVRASTIRKVKRMGNAWVNQIVQSN